jgi:peptidoglycan/LPS O-acetylase OafA/YrhL
VKYRSEIDGLRAVAVIPVILFHAGFKQFSGGFVGVDVFFVISGYLITTILLNDLHTGNYSLLHFYERRARRILPALFAVMLACLPFAWFWLLPQDMLSFSDSLKAVSVFSSNILFLRTSGYFDSATELKPLIHTWSLAVEEQYYVFFPLFLLFTWRFGRRWIAALLTVIAVVSIALAQYLLTRRPAFDFYALPTRSWELMIGALVAYYYTEHNINKHKHFVSESLSLLGFALIGFSIFTYNEKTPLPGVYALAPTLGAALVIVFAKHRTLIGNLLGSKPFVAVGLISYSAYLWHQPMFAFARHRSMNEPRMVVMAALAVASLGLAYLTWRFIERPFRSRYGFTRNQVFALAVAGSAMFSGIGFALPLFDQHSMRLEVNNNIVGEETGQKEFYSFIKSNFPDCEDTEVRKSAPYFETLQMCQQSKRGKPDIVLLGDSHAEYLFYGLQKELPNENIAEYVQWEKPYLSNPEFAAIFKSLSEPDSPKTVILTMHYFGRLYSTNNDLYPNFRQLISYLKDLNKNVVLVGDVPRYPYDVDNCRYFRSFTKTHLSCAMSISRANAQQATYLNSLTALAAEFHIQFINLYPLFCNTEYCSMLVNNQLLYRDSNHINRYASALVARYLIANSAILQRFASATTGPTSPYVQVRAAY